MGTHEVAEDASICIVGDVTGIYGLTYEPVSQIVAAVARELDAPMNEDIAGPSRRLDPSGVTSLFDPTYLAGCALALPELDDADKGRFVDPVDDDCDEELDD